MTDDLSQCWNCIYHYTYNSKDMCKQVGDDFTYNGKLKIVHTIQALQRQQQ